MTTPPADLGRVQTFLNTAFQVPEPIAFDPSLSARVAEHVAGNDHLSPAEQADLYREQFFLRHVECLLEDHPGVAHYLGDDGFDAFARAYLAAHPPRTPSLRDLGQDVATFAATWPGVPAHLRDACVDMARYELAFVELFDAPDVPPPDPARLSSIPQEDWLSRPLVLTPLLRLVELRSPAPELRRAVKQGSAPADPPPPAPARYAIFRRDDAVCFEPLSAEAFDLLGLLSSGRPLADACEELCRELDAERAANIEAEVGGWFRKWASWGFFLDVKSQ